MSKKIYKILLAGALGVVLLFGVAAGVSDFRLAQSMDVFFNVFKSVSTMYVDPVDGEKMLESAADAMLSSLDPYTEFIPKSEVAQFETMTTRRYGGVGSIISASADSSGYVRIITPYRDAPIDKVGIKPGAQILSIDGESMEGRSTSDVSDAMKGEPGTELKMVTRSLLTGEPERHTIKREIISISAVTYYGFVADSTGYIALESFSEGCGRQIRDAVNEMNATGRLSSLILDLRGNGGGLMNEAINIVSLFVPKGSHVLSSKGRMSEDNITFNTSTTPIVPDLPLVVMVDRSSASASEIVAGALQDLDRAVIVGQRTFGKGLIQTTREVGFGNIIKVTTAKYYIPSGRCIQALDYSHRNEDGSVGSVPDSLISEFVTQGGRKVYDGGGIAPDIDIQERHFSKFPVSLYAMGYIDNFSLEYYKENRSAPDIRTFKLSDEDYDKFKEYVSDKEITFRSRSEYNLDQLIASAKSELYYDQIKEDIERIEKQLSGDRQTDLELYKDDITEYLEQAIITRYHYPEGAAERIAVSDKDVKRSVEIVTDTTLYNDILSME